MDATEKIAQTQQAPPPLFRPQPTDQELLARVGIIIDTPNVTDVHQQEGNDQNAENRRAEQNFRHRGWLNERKCILDALEGLCGPCNRTANFEACGTRCFVEHSPSTERVRLRAYYCKDRFCRPCGIARARRIAINLEQRLLIAKGKPSYRFLTFTLKHSRRPLAPQIDALLKGFREVRRSKLWQCSQEGGAQMFELKVGTDGLWHPHLHVITEGAYIPQDKLRELWRTITGESTIVDVRMIHDAEQVARYVAKYAAYPLDPTCFKHIDYIEDAIISLKGRRLCNCFGSWRGLELEAKPPDPGDWIIDYTLCDLLRKLERRDPGAIRFCRKYNICKAWIDEESDLFNNSS